MNSSGADGTPKHANGAGAAREETLVTNIFMKGVPNFKVSSAPS